MRAGLLRKKSRHSAGFFSYLLLVPTPRRAKHDTPPAPTPGPAQTKFAWVDSGAVGIGAFSSRGGQTVGGVVGEYGMQMLVTYSSSPRRRSGSIVFPWMFEIMGYECIFPLLRIIIISMDPGLLSPHKHVCVCGGPMPG